MKKPLITILCLIFMVPTDASASETDLSNIRAIHMGGNWGANHALREWNSEEPPNGYIEWLRSVNANWVGLTVSLNVLNSMDSQVKRSYSESTSVPTFTDEHLTTIIEKLKENGFHVYLTLSFEIHEVDDPEKFLIRGALGIANAYEWHPDINWEYWPWALDHPDRAAFVSEFWSSFTEQAVHFATLAESLDVEMYSLGTETDGLFRTRPDGEYRPYHFKEELQEMVASVREVYSGLLTYDQHFTEVAYDRPAQDEGTKWLWRDLGLDIIGVSAYFHLADSVPEEKIPYDQLKDSIEQVFVDYILPTQVHNPDIPIVFAEFGYTNSIGSPYRAHWQEQTPIDYSDQDNNELEDGEETQADIYRAMFDINEKYGRVVKGAFLWGHDWLNDQSWQDWWGSHRVFDIRGKLAEDVVRDVYGGWVSSLSGNVRDSSDGTTPIHPVFIGLVDPDTGAELIRFGTQNNPDGSYEISGIPPGNYKIFFDANGSASAYVDELYNDIPCNEVRCDKGLLGNIFVLAKGLSTLDVGLDRGFLISGSITDESANPISSVLLNVFDQSGNYVCCSARSDQTGSWSMTLPSAGDYYVLTVGDSAPDYFPEVWNNKPCDGCDPVTTGDPVKVVDSDIGGIDFQLILKPPEVILKNGFEGINVE